MSTQMIRGGIYMSEKEIYEKAPGLELGIEENSGSYISGFAGALVGSILGGIVWAVVLNFGYVASIIGYLIGWLAEKGYTLLKGKDGKGKIVILAIMAILGVAIGTIGAQVIEMIKLISNGEMPGLTYYDIPLWVSELFKDSEYVGYMIKDFGLGLIFAFLGCFSFLKNKGKKAVEKESKETKSIADIVTDTATEKEEDN